MASPGAKPLQPRFLASVAVVALLHAALLWVATAPIDRPVVRDERVWVQVLHLRAPQVFSTQPVAEPVRKQAPATAAPARSAPGKQAGVPLTSLPAPAAQAQLTPPMPPMPPTQPAPPSSANDTLETVQGLAIPGLGEKPDMSARAAPSDIRQQALKAVGAIDRQLRAEHPQPLKAPTDSQAARLSRGIAAARDAVKPKWFEAARTELISAPNDPKRIYRVTTGMGEYCLYYPDKASISANSSAASGAASFGQPTAGSCPTAF